MSSRSFATGPSPFVGQDLFAQAKAALIAQVPAQVQQNLSSAGNTTVQPSFGLGTGGTLTNTAAVQPQSLFSNTLNQTSNQTGLLGSTMSPFGTPGSTTFQTGGKRGKH